MKKMFNTKFIALCVVLISVGVWFRLVPVRHMVLFWRVRTNPTIELLQEVGPDTDYGLVPWFIVAPALEDNEYAVRVCTAAYLHDIQPSDSRVKSVLLEAVESSDVRAKVDALELLTDLYPDDLQTVDVTLKALTDSDKFVRFVAVRCISENPLRRGEWLEDIARLLTDQESPVRLNAAYGLAKFGEDAIPYLVKGLSDGDVTMRVTLVRLLSEMAYYQGSERAAAEAKAALQQEMDESARAWMLEAISEMESLRESGEGMEPK